MSRLAAWQQIDNSTQWHEILTGLPAVHPLQSWVWGDFKSRWGWSMQPLALPAEAGGYAAAALVLRRQMPRLPFSFLYIPKGPLFDYDDASLRERVLDSLQALARREGAMFVKIDPDVVRSRGLEPEESDETGVAWLHSLQTRGWRFSNDQVQFRNTVLLDLTQDEETLLAAMKSKTRYNIRLAGRKEVVVRQVGPEAFATIAGMYETTAERNEFGIRPQAYYLDAWHSLYAAGMAQPFLAEYAGTPIAAVIVVRYGDLALYMYGASTEEERNRMPAYLLQWEAICWAKAQGCRVYDFWGAPDEFVEEDPLWGVWRFKSGFEGQVVRHIGAWDYPVRPAFYWLFNVLLPRYRDWLRARSR
ncbi:MAG: peptidoglycan bridge formation glycyltransferase FemA/FemB family protein [Anaerolineae bacterium]|nr:peptidoglycan bridge formation glycyltransferase FemA/FemB family protein [Anaerolineae bacterium]